MIPPSIAVLCAAHRGNSGMYSVDSAAVAYFGARPCSYDLFVTQADSDASSTLRGRPVSVLASPERLAGYSHVVYWGDFLNNPAYGMGDFASRDVRFGHSPDKDAAFDRWRGLFVDPPTEARLVSVGTNFQHDFASRGSRLREVFGVMERRFHAILPRDPFSVQNLSRMMSFEGQAVVRAGMDCAFLLPPRKAIERTDTFCFTFNRSKIEGTDRLVRLIEERTGLKGVELPRWLRLRGPEEEVTFHRFRGALARARFALSDTYHFLINSIIQGTPAIALGREASRQTGTLGDFKKRALFGMLGLEDLYCELRDDDEAAYFEEVAAVAARIIADGFAPQRRYRHARGLADKFRSDVDQAIFGTREIGPVTAPAAEPAVEGNGAVAGVQ
jgi:hypothetical protein